MQFYKDKSSIQSSKNWFHFLRWGKIISLYTPSNTSAAQRVIIQVQVAAYIKSEAITAWGVRVNVLASQGCDQGGNGLGPVLMLSSVDDVLGNCGGEWEDAWWSPLMQKKNPTNTMGMPNEGEEMA